MQANHYSHAAPHRERPLKQPPRGRRNGRASRPSTGERGAPSPPRPGPDGRPAPPPRGGRQPRDRARRQAARTGRTTQARTTQARSGQARSGHADATGLSRVRSLSSSNPGIAMCRACPTAPTGHSRIRRRRPTPAASTGEGSAETERRMALTARLCRWCWREGRCWWEGGCAQRPTRWYSDDTSCGVRFRSFPGRCEPR